MMMMVEWVESTGIVVGVLEASDIGAGSIGGESPFGH